MLIKFLYQNAASQSTAHFCVIRVGADVFTVKRRLRDFRREKGYRSDASTESGLLGASGKVVLTAIAINGSNFLFKLFAWLYTGSHSMFSESIHSLADTINQLILAFGIHKSVQEADSDHPYGYSNMKYVASLISGVGIFCVGTGLSFYHGVTGLLSPMPTESFYWAFFILGGSLVSEGATLLVAVNSIRKGAQLNKMTFTEYVLQGQDPSVNVVLMEDLAAVIGVGVAGVCMGLTVHYGSPIPDAVGSLLVGGILGGVASFLIYTNVAALVGRSIPQERLDKINSELESDVMIRAIHDVKGIDMGNSLVRYKAELDFDGRELSRSYLDKQDLNLLLEEVQKMKNIDELEAFILKHGENIVDMMGAEIDRIEMKLRSFLRALYSCMGVQGRDILLLVKSDATNPQDTLFLRTIEVDSIIEEESDAFCEDWIWPSAKDISLSSYIYIEICMGEVGPQAVASLMRPGFFRWTSELSEQLVMEYRNSILFTNSLFMMTEFMFGV
ncbi:hypothetical protein Cfor_01110 [Coptotermes formosanus]|uniref:Cation efflux protein transmembrane domain-containing protein n=1 Tax=Coptotermes formosanus TaxID=36987 RepID=A0A6L2PZ61_COPFO|nr:hypothetical protein Cfor_01110 [Coptotermes formosanus]